VEEELKGKPLLKCEGNLSGKFQKGEKAQRLWEEPQRFLKNCQRLI